MVSTTVNKSSKRNLPKVLNRRSIEGQLGHPLSGTTSFLSRNSKVMALRIPAKYLKIEGKGFPESVAKLRAKTKQAQRKLGHPTLWRFRVQPTAPSDHVGNMKRMAW